MQPLNFIREIDGTTYAVRAFFSEDAERTSPKGTTHHPEKR
ncbi:MAG: hypothetical protein ACLU9S_04440 [Oscillospiraceae bacterium]